MLVVVIPFGIYFLISFLIYSHDKKYEIRGMNAHKICSCNMIQIIYQIFVMALFNLEYTHDLNAIKTSEGRKLIKLGIYGICHIPFLFHQLFLQIYIVFLVILINYIKSLFFRITHGNLPLSYIS